MCGIYCLLSRCENGSRNDSQFNFCKGSLLNRGPDAFKSVCIQLTEDWFGFFAGSVLWTQGFEAVEQPLYDGNLLLWNGDIYEGLGANEEGVSDTELVFKELEKDPESLFSKVCGPYAFVFWDSAKKRLWFGRDPVGRHSLLWDIGSSELRLCSVGNCELYCEEVPTCGIFAIDLSKSVISLEIHPWSHADSTFPDLKDLKVTVDRKDTISHRSLDSALLGKNYALEGRTPGDSDLSYLNGIAGLQDYGGQELLSVLLQSPDFSERVKRLKALLFESVKRRVVTQPRFCKGCVGSKLLNCLHTKLGVLFSGGLDSSLLALIADRFVPNDEPIDLYNVAFERPNVPSAGFRVPDRETGYRSLEELKRLSPQRTWNFIEINITQSKLCALRSERIRDLIHPRSSILDDSLGCALWFAARGEGTLDGIGYSSTARIVLLGMGADELFGGYSRHRKVFRRGGWAGLDEELREEIRNISGRNLGRDNRVVSDHGRQPRTPFLDENVISFASGLPPWERCCLTPDLPQGVGDKLLLRLLAFDLGFRNVSTFPKRALQFGSRIANPKEKGHEVCARLNKNPP